jgi:hypothetical protein
VYIKPNVYRLTLKARVYGEKHETFDELSVRIRLATTVGFTSHKVITIQKGSPVQRNEIGS